MTMPPADTQQELISTLGEKKIIIPSGLTIIPLLQDPIDDERSQKGQFGWDVLGKEHIPYIFRGDATFFSVRMVEPKVLYRYLATLHLDILTKCTNIPSYYITENEVRLLNEINFAHCEGIYGRTQFTGEDLIVSTQDLRSFCEFLEICFLKLSGRTAFDKCGFVKINGDACVPFVISWGVKYVPIFYFEGETDKLKSKSVKLTGWDLAYLKFLCRIQKLQNELFTFDSCSVIDINEIVNHFPPNTTFEDDWPETAKELFVGLNVVNTKGGIWTRAPKTPQICSAIPTTNSQGASPSSEVTPGPEEPAPALVHFTVGTLSLRNVNGKSQSEPVKLIPIPEPEPTVNGFQPYKFQRVIIDGKTIPCINMKPFAFTDFLMLCIIDVNEYLFKNIPFHAYSAVIQALRVPLYKANNCQVNVFMSNNRYRYCNSILPLISVKDVLAYLPQMKYMLLTNDKSHHPVGTDINNKKC